MRPRKNPGHKSENVDNLICILARNIHIASETVSKIRNFCWLLFMLHGQEFHFIRKMRSKYLCRVNYKLRLAFSLNIVFQHEVNSIFTS